MTKEELENAIKDILATTQSLAESQTQMAEKLEAIQPSPKNKGADGDPEPDDPQPTDDNPVDDDDDDDDGKEDVGSEDDWAKELGFN